MQTVFITQLMLQTIKNFRHGSQQGGGRKFQKNHHHYSILLASHYPNKTTFYHFSNDGQNWEFKNFPSLYGLILNRSYWLLLYKKNWTRRNEVWKYLIWKFQLLKVTPCPSQTVWETELRLLLKIIIDLSDGALVEKNE